ncbi:MAG: Hint domain-containing protein [Rhodobacteraceae bacterium]|nr:Hint domain-containing protein [Paracoccaceae bacterium]
MLGGAGNDTLEGNNGHDLIFGDDGHGVASSTQVVTLVSQNGDYDGALIIEIVNADGTVADTVTLTPSYDANIGNSWTVELDADQDLRVSITSPEGTFASDSVNAQGTMISDDTARLNFEDLAGLGDGDFNDVVIDVMLSPNGSGLLVEHGVLEAVKGAPGNDLIHAGSGDDTVFGEGGNDTIHGDGGNDLLDGGDGNDLLDGGAGADLIKGAGGRDTILGGTHGDEIDGGAGGDDHDTLDLSGVGKFRLEDLRPDSNGNGQDGTVVLLDDEGNEISRFVFTEIETIIGDPEPTPDGYVDGTDGDDLIDVDYDGDPNGDFVDNDDALLPGEAPQDDIIRAGDGDDTVFAGEGDDEIHGGAGDDEIFGEDGNDSIGGNQGNDLIDGADGDDTLFGQDGNDSLIGGDGNDSLIGGQDGDLLHGGDGNDTIDGFSGDDEILGGDGDDKLVGGGGDDTIDGQGGDDHIAGGNNVDVIDGGAGDDTITAGSRGDTVTGGDGNDSIDGEQGDDLIISGPKGKPDLGYPGLFPGDSDPDNDKDTVDGGSGNDTIFTGDDDDLITGGTGDDVIDGGFDKDTIDAGEGDDRIVGGEGSDSILGGEGNDTIFAGIDPALGLPDNLDIPDDAGDLQPENGKDFVDGGAGNDVILGQDDDDTLEGGDGDDFINGGVDDDVIRGGAGDDTIEGGEGEDNLSGGADQDTFQTDDDGAGSFIGDTVDGGAGGVDHDTLDLRGTVTEGGRLAVTETGPDSNGNGVNGFVEYFYGDDNLLGTLEFTEIEKVIVCFTPGTTIATPKGEMAVETLRPGDKVMTRDNGIQEIAWTGARDLSSAEVAAAQDLRPVMIKAGALGPNLPERDMMVSPQHRVLLANDRTQLYFEEREVLVAAKHLVGMKGITRMGDVDTTYVHFMCEKHEVVLSGGAWTETFQPGDYTLAGMDGAARKEILALFPELATHAGLKDYVSARKALKRHEASLLVAR